MSSLVIQGDTSGSVTLQPASLGSNVTITLPLSGNNLFSNICTLAAGNTDYAPLTFTSSNTTTTALTGSWEYDGKALYGTPQTTQRGIIPCGAYYVNLEDLVLSSDTILQSLFTADTTGTSPGLLVSSNTAYHFDSLIFILMDPANVTGAAPLLGFGGTAIEDVTVRMLGYASTTQGTSGNSNEYQSDTIALKQQESSATSKTYRIKGAVSFSTGGTIIPQLQWSAAASYGAWTLRRGSYFHIYPVGPANPGSDVVIGTWA